MASRWILANNRAAIHGLLTVRKSQEKEALRYKCGAVARSGRVSSQRRSLRVSICAARNVRQHVRR